MNIEFINVGYGEATLVQSGEQVLLIDGGSDEDAEFAGGEARIRCMDYLRARGIDHIDLMLCTHPHEDHICGLWAVANALPVHRFCTSALPSAGAAPLPLSLAPDASTHKFIRALNTHAQLLALFRKKGVLVERLSRGTVLKLGALQIEVLSPSATRAEALEEALNAIYAAEQPLPLIQTLDPRLNNLSLALRISGGGVRALLVGDTNRDGYGDMKPCELRADIYKIGHHGQADGVCEAQLDAAKPRYVLCCASSDRRYGSAHPELQGMVRRCGAQLLFTDPPGGCHQAVCISACNGEIRVRYRSVKN